VTELHDKYLPEEYFPIVGSIPRFPRYKNKRTMDPFAKSFIDEQYPGEMDSYDWGLPKPNQEAAFKSLSKYGKDILPMTPKQIENINTAWEWTERHFGVYMKNSKVRSYLEVKPKLDMSTSTGAPFNILYKTKKELFENDPDIDEWFEKDWMTLANDPNWTCLCTNSLKEEIRPSEKIRQNKIRTFTAMAVDMTVHGNRLFADMNEKMNDSWLRSSSTVGWSPYGRNWDRMIKKLKKHPNGYALDESEYDSSLRSYMMWGCAELRWNMLQETDRTADNLTRLKTIYRNLISSIIVSPTGVLVQKLTGNPSGSPNTINDNTLILYTLMAYAWLETHPYVEDTSLAEFETETAKCLCGDDNTWSVSNWAHPFYNAHTVIDCWKAIGVTTTTDDMEARDVDDLDYLSAHTIYLNNCAVPIYDHTKILTSLLYSAGKDQGPVLALNRVNGLIINGYTNHWCRKFLREYQEWLLSKYDKVMSEDPEWKIAKAGIHADRFLERLYCGDTIARQGFVYGKKKQTDPIKTIDRNMSQVIQIKQRKPRTKRGGKGPKKVKATRTVVVKQQRNRAPRKRRGRNQNTNNGYGNSNNGGNRLTMRGRNSGNTNGLSRRSCVVEEHELILDLSNQAVAGAFTVTNTLPLNPGQATTFPWLHLQAKQWERYEIDYLRIEYKREVSEFNASGTAGKVMIGVDIDASDGAPATKVAFMDMERDLIADGMPCENFAIKHIPRQRLHPKGVPKYVRPGGLPGNASILDFDVGNLFIAISGTANDTTKLGEIHITYRVRFSVPVLSEQQAVPINNNVALFQTPEGGLQNMVNNTPVRLTLTQATFNGIGATNVGGLILLPLGNYLVDFGSFTFASTDGAMQMSMQPVKNTNSLTGTGDGIPQSGGLYDGSITTSSVSFSGYVQSNGTDTVSVEVTVIETAETSTAAGWIRIVAI